MHTDREMYSVLNWEFKNELVQISSDLIEQNKALFCTFAKDQHIRSPMLLACVAGCHYLQVFGAAWNGHEMIEELATIITVNELGKWLVLFPDPQARD